MTSLVLNNWAQVFINQLIDYPINNANTSSSGH